MRDISALQSQFCFLFFLLLFNLLLLCSIPYFIPFSHYFEFLFQSLFLLLRNSPFFFFVFFLSFSCHLAKKTSKGSSLFSPSQLFSVFCFKFHVCWLIQSGVGDGFCQHFIGNYWVWNWNSSWIGYGVLLLHLFKA